MRDEWYINTSQLAELLSLKPQTLRNWRCSGRGPQYIRFGGPRGRILYRASDVDEWLKARTFTSTSEETVRATMDR